MESLISLVSMAGTAMTILIFVRVLLSWIQPAQENRVANFVFKLTEPILAPVRSILPAMGGFDFSPILVLFGIQLAERLIIRLLIGMAQNGSVY